VRLMISTLDPRWRDELSRSERQTAACSPTGPGRSVAPDGAAVTEQSEAEREALADLDSHAAGATMIEVHGGRAFARQPPGL